MANFSLLAKIGADTKGFQKGIDKADTRRKKFQTGLGGLKTALAGLGLGRVAMEAINLGSAISDMATQLNIGTEELQVLEFAAREAGVETGIMERAIRNVQLRTQQGIEGNKRYAEAYETLGLNIAEVSKMPVEKKLEAIAKASANATDKQAAYNAVAAILGERAGPKMQEILQSLAKEGFAPLAAAAKASGTVMDKDVIAKMDKAADKIEQVKRRMTVMVGTILTYALPAFNSLKNGIGIVADSLGASAAIVVQWGLSLGKVISAVIAPAITSFESLSAGVEGVAQALAGNPEAAKKAFAKSKKLAAQVAKDFKAIPGEMASAAKDMKTTADSAFEVMGKSIGKRAKEMSDDWADAFGKIKDDAKDTFGGGSLVWTDPNADKGEGDGDSKGKDGKPEKKEKEDTRGDFVRELSGAALKEAANVAGKEDKRRFERMSDGTFQEFVNGKKGKRISEEQLKGAVEAKVESKTTDSLLKAIDKKLEGKFVNES